MTTLKQRRVTHLRYQIFPSIALAFFAFLLWLCGPNALPLSPWLCLLSVLVTAQHIFFEAKLPSLFTWFSVTYISLFLVYPIVAPLIGIKIPTTNDVFFKYCFLAVGSLHLFIIGYELASYPHAKRRWEARYRTTSDRLFNMICLLFILNILASVLVLADAGSFSVLESRTRNEMKYAIGILSIAGIYVYMMGIFMYPLLGVYLRYRKYRIVVWLPVVVGFEIFMFLMFRTRTFPVMHFFGVLIGWFLIASRMIIAGGDPNVSFLKRLSAVQKISITVLIAVLVIGMFVLRVFRGNYEKAGSIAEININIPESIQYAFERGGELGYSEWVFKILEKVPEHHDYMYGQSYYRLLFVPIPRSLWQEKPQNSQRIVAQWIDPGAVSVQTTPVGIFGDLYVNFGMFGMLGMLIFGYAFGIMDRSQQLTNALFLSISFSMVFHMVRGGFTNPLLEMVTSFLTAQIVANYLHRGIFVRRKLSSNLKKEKSSMIELNACMKKT